MLEYEDPNPPPSLPLEPPKKASFCIFLSKNPCMGIFQKVLIKMTNQLVEMRLWQHRHPFLPQYQLIRACGHKLLVNIPIIHDKNYWFYSPYSGVWCGVCAISGFIFIFRSSFFLFFILVLFFHALVVFLL